MVAYAHWFPTLDFLSFPACRLEAPQALFNPVAAGIKVSFRLRHWRVGV